MTFLIDTDKLPQGDYLQVGTVLQRRDSSEEGQSLLLFLRDFGPQWVSAPASKTKCRFGGAIEPLTWAEFNLYQSPTRLYLKSAEVKEDFISLRCSAGKLRAALKFYKRLSKSLLVGHESNNILTLLWSSMLLLKENCPVDIVEYRFTWKLLKESGLAPSLLSCVKCGSRLDAGALWTNDGLICLACSGSNKNGITGENLKSIRAAALLNHEKFIEWSKSEQKTALYKDELNKLVTFFTDWD